MGIPTAVVLTSNFGHAEKFHYFGQPFTFFLETISSLLLQNL
ncbi:hypothetical protein AM1_6297 [Acaryochloris marina MBIC11017]|uniref:Uncharacterized protein n=1 Tax=Acaryochloris marina (strain MBIC 11017) TaxID=329726 RepID=B0C7E3_ACAM1|nr:hypothetical protein AM1_6297 [Acaryochloris marina MBIC11017]